MSQFSATYPQPVRVLHIAQSVAGGVASVLDEVIPFQSQAFGPRNVRLLMPSGNERHLGSIDPAQVLTFAATGRGPLDLVRFACAARRAIEMIRPDIVHLHSTFAGAVVRALSNRQGRNARIVYCAHGWAFGMEVATWKRRLYALVERILARRTDMVLCISQVEYDLAVRMGHPPMRMRVVRNGIERTRRPILQNGAGPIKLVFLGRLDWQKGFDILLDAVGQIPPGSLELHVIGDSILTKKQIENRGDTDVVFHGWLARAEAMTLLQRMDALVMPSRWEGFGLAAIEAMRAGLPVIASNRGALPEVVQHGIGGLIFNLDDRQGLVRLLAGLERDSLRRLGQTARRRFESEFTAERMNNEICDAYQTILTNDVVSEPSFLKRDQAPKDRNDQTQDHEDDIAALPPQVEPQRYQDHSRL